VTIDMDGKRLSLIREIKDYDKGVTDTLRSQANALFQYVQNEMESELTGGERKIQIVSVEELG